MLLESTILAKIAPLLVKPAIDALKPPALRALGRDTWSKALKTANQEFVKLFTQELSIRGPIRRALIPQYEESLAAFCSSEAVQAILAQPFDASTPLNYERLRILWEEVRDHENEPLLFLPAGFSWDQMAAPYKQAVLGIMRGSPEMLPLLQEAHQRRIAENTDRQAGPARALDPTGYRAALRERYGLLRLGDIDGDWSRYHLRLQSLYIPQGAKQALPPREITRDYWERLATEGRQDRKPDKDDAERKRRFDEYREAVSRPILEIVNDSANQKLVVLGDPGLGKSTLVQYLALSWAEDQIPPLPLLIELRQYVNDASEERGFLRYLDSAPGVLWQFPRLELDRRLRSETMLVMFDGLDEVIDHQERANVVNEIVRFAGEYPRARIIVTTRIVGYHPGSSHPETFRNAGFAQFTLQDFEPAEMERFNQRWHAAAFSQQPDDLQKYSARLREGLASSPAILELAGNPLLLTFMALLNRNQPLPRNRRLLYEKTAELLLRNWDVPKFGDAEDRIGVDEKKRMLQAVAFEIQEKRTGIGVNQIDIEALRRILRAYLKDSLGLSDPVGVADDLLGKLHARNHMLCYLGDRQYGFVHRTFLEYFCALALQERLERTRQLTLESLRELVREWWRQDAWHEVLRLLCGMLDAEQAGVLIRELLGQQDAEEGWRAVILAADCLDEVPERGRVRKLGDVLQDAVVKLTRYDPPYYWEGSMSGYELVEQVQSAAYERWARVWRLPQVMTALAARVRSGDWEERIYCLRELARGWKEVPEVLPLLEDRARNDPENDVRSAAVGELARGWREHPGVLPLLMDRASNDEDAAVQIVAVRELAHGWKEVPGVLPLLKNCARNNPNYSVRRTALRELAGGWKEDPEVPLLLNDRARNDENYAVQTTALSELAQGWKEDPDVLLFLKDRARNDPFFEIRRTALRELARHWKDDLDVVPLLMDRARDDDNDTVRAAAVSGLAQGWKEDPAVLLWLKDRARAGQSSGLRSAALRELAEGWKEDPEVPLILKDRARNDEDYDVRSTAVSESAQGWEEDPEVLPLLIDRAINDPHSDVRRTAVTELARGWAEDPDVRTLLKSRACNDSDTYVRSAAVRELARAWKEDPGAPTLLKDRALNDPDNDVRMIAVRELAQVWREDPGVLPLLKDRARNDPDNYVRRAAARELARTWKQDPDVLPLLKDRARNDPEGIVRDAAVSELLRGWKKDAEMLPLLKDRARNDEDHDVLSTVVRELARVWKEDPDVLPLLEDRARNDEDDGVRSTTVSELARGWKKDPGILSLLTDRARNDGSDEVRSTAVSELARGWKEDPAVLPLLMDRAANDGSASVRSLALSALAQRWKDEPEVLPMLMDRFHNDSDKAVRLAAFRELDRGWHDDPEVFER